MGAAQAVRKDGALVLVVRYSPPGNYNMRTAFEENVLPINSGTTRTCGLCYLLLSLLLVFLLKA